MQIRSFMPDDTAQVTALHIASWQQTYRGLLPDHALDYILPEEFTAFWRETVPMDHDIHLVAEEAEIIVGIMSILRQDAPYVDRLHTHPDWRSRGIGQALMQAAAKQLEQEGYRSLWLYVAQANVRALAFYQRLGGQITLEKDNVHYDTALPCFRIDWPDVSMLARAI